MIMLKKLKLTLLMSGIVFFSKEVYAVGPDENLKTVPLKPSSSNHQPSSSLLPVFPHEQDVDGQPFVGPSSFQPSSSQVSVASSSSEANFNLDQFPGGLTIRGRDLYTAVLQNNIETDVDLKKIFNLSDIQECKEAQDSINTIISFFYAEARKPLKEVEEKLDELENQFKAQLKAQFEEGPKRLRKSLDLSGKLTDLRWASVKKVDKLADKILSSYSSMLKDLPLYVDLIRQEIFVNNFKDKAHDVLDEPEGFTEAFLADSLEKAPENSRNLIERMAGPFFKVRNLMRSMEQIPPFPEDKRDPKTTALYDKLLKTKNGVSLYNDLWRNNIGTHIDLTKYFDFNDDQGRKEAKKTLSIVSKILERITNAPLEEVDEKLEKSMEKLKDDEYDFCLLERFKLLCMLTNETSINDFLMFCSELLENHKSQESELSLELSLYIDLMQKTKFANNLFERATKVENFTEATLVDFVKEIPESLRSSRNLIERMARPLFIMKNLEESVEDIETYLPEIQPFGGAASSNAN